MFVVYFITLIYKKPLASVKRNKSEKGNHVIIARTKLDFLCLSSFEIYIQTNQIFYLLVTVFDDLCRNNSA